MARTSRFVARGSKATRCLVPVALGAPSYDGHPSLRIASSPPLGVLLPASHRSSTKGAKVPGHIATTGDRGRIRRPRHDNTRPLGKLAMEDAGHPHASASRCTRRVWNLEIGLGQDMRISHPTSPTNVAYPIIQIVCPPPPPICLAFLFFFSCKGRTDCPTSRSPSDDHPRLAGEMRPPNPANPLPQRPASLDSRTSPSSPSLVYDQRQIVFWHGFQLWTRLTTP